MIVGQRNPQLAFVQNIGNFTKFRYIFKNSMGYRLETKTIGLFLLSFG